MNSSSSARCGVSGSPAMFWSGSRLGALAEHLARARRGPRRGLAAIGLTGRTGGEMPGRCDLCLFVPSDSTQLIQQVHITVGHIICGLVEGGLFPRTPAQ